MNAFDRLLLSENLNYAWLKAKSLYRSADGYFDRVELAEFELDLEQRLLSIRKKFERGSYQLHKLQPLPRPKKLKDDGTTIDRQYFHVAVEDQVAWIAVANALGPELDQMMPSWSYGNRLYRPAWYEKGENRESKLEIGPYRHASGHLYRKFQHSWPLFRRHVALTARAMVARRPLRTEEMDESDRLAAASAERAQLPYFSAGFWPAKSAVPSSNELYHASIDLKQFYPQLKTEAVMVGLGLAGAMSDPRMQSLLNDMLRFRLDRTNMPDATLKNVEPLFLKRDVRGIPTGLFVSGFLANAAMLSVDLAVGARISEFKSVAHFRFVDDHTIIAYNFDDLCDWIIWYEELLETGGIGAVVNQDKFDPTSLRDWIKRRKKIAARSITSASQQEPLEPKRVLAANDARIDGKNPTKLMTKTLAQVSAIATTDIHILDDEDLEERLKMLEWLLLADIPDREIRPDTRAAFAAGQIAVLAPVIIQEADGLVDAARYLARIKGQEPDAERATKDDVERHRQQIAEISEQLSNRQDEHDKLETEFLRRCFRLLFGSFRQHPGKSRLLFRILQYCRVTGYNGLKEIADWLKESRTVGNQVWSDYYAGLSLQILSYGILASTRVLQSHGALRSDVAAALKHLEHVSRLNVEAFLTDSDHEAWFHSTARIEFGVTLIAVAEMLRHCDNTSELSARLLGLGRKCVNISSEMPVESWLTETGRTSGAWAHLFEGTLSIDDKPSKAWHKFSVNFSSEHRTDILAARRYPKLLPNTEWKHLLTAKSPLPPSDSGWLREVIDRDDTRLRDARSSSKKTFTKAARSAETPPDNLVTLSDWTAAIAACSPFDPRRSEWTALEIVGQLIGQVIEFNGDEAMLDRLHPDNVLLPKAWLESFDLYKDWSDISWERWRRFAQQIENGKVVMRDPTTSLLDYRFATDGKVSLFTDEWERRLVAVGRLLLGLVRNDYSAPSIWNLRGNEQVFRLPLARWFESLAISSPTLLLIESCLSARSAETRTISRAPGLFGWKEGVSANDVEYDPPTLVGANTLLDAIRNAQQVLTANQIAVAMNQPRQLIPFRLKDFAIGSDPDDATREDDNGE